MLYYFYISFLGLFKTLSSITKGWWLYDRHTMLCVFVENRMTFCHIYYDMHAVILHFRLFIFWCCCGMHVALQFVALLALLKTYCMCLSRTPRVYLGWPSQINSSSFSLTTSFFKANNWNLRYKTVLIATSQPQCKKLVKCHKLTSDHGVNGGSVYTILRKM